MVCIVIGLFFLSSTGLPSIKSVLAPCLRTWTWYGFGMDQTRTGYGDGLILV